MADFPALPLWTDALIGDTVHLSPAEFGAYLRLLITAWRRPGCDLPDDNTFLARCAGDHKNWWRLRPAVMVFWTLHPDGMWRQKRLTKEREFVTNRSAAQAANARARWSVDKSAREENESEFLPHTVRTDRARDTMSRTIRNNDLTDANGYANRMPPHPQEVSKKESSFFGGGKTNGNGFENPANRLAAFQAKLAATFPARGTEIIAAAADPSDPQHQMCLKLAKAAASSLRKGWPHNWPC